MKNLFAFIFTIAITFSLGAQVNHNDIAVSGIDNSINQKFTSTAISSPEIRFQQLSFIGGSSAIHKIIQENIKYPNVNFVGKVEVDLTIDSNGKLVHSEIVTEVNPAIEMEVLRLSGLLQSWKPNIKSGVKQKSKFRLGIIFSDRLN